MDLFDDDITDEELQDEDCNEDSHSDNDRCLDCDGRRCICGIVCDKCNTAFVSEKYLDKNNVCVYCSGLVF